MDLILSFAAWWAPVIIAALAIAGLGLTQIRAGWLLAAMAASAGYVALNFLGRDLIPLERWFGELSWNWEGKLAALGGTLLASVALMAIFRRRITPSSLGFRLRPNQGSIAPALAATLIGVALAAGLEIWSADGPDLNPERLLYQATMPGLDEELFYRGLLLALMMLAVPSKGLNLLGARFDWAAFLLAAQFGLMHGVAVSDGALTISWIAVAATAALGFAPLWIRLRTGGVLIPILAHNAINFSGSFF